MIKIRYSLNWLILILLFSCSQGPTEVQEAVRFEKTDSGYILYQNGVNILDLNYSGEFLKIKEFYTDENFLTVLYDTPRGITMDAFYMNDEGEWYPDYIQTGFSFISGTFGKIADSISILNGNTLYVQYSVCGDPKTYEHFFGAFEDYSTKLSLTPNGIYEHSSERMISQRGGGLTKYSPRPRIKSKHSIFN